MDGLQYIDIILLAMVAGFIALRLRSVLGKRTGDEETRAEKRHTAPMEQPAGAQTEEGRAAARADWGKEESGTWRVGIDAESPLGKTLSRIKVADRNFDPESFLEGAQSAYSMIVEAYASGDRETLQGLLAPEIYRDFESAIEEREQKNQTMETKVVDIEEVKIEDASLEDKTAEITLRFTAHIMSVTRDEEERIIAGNTSDAEKCVDIWTFARNTASRDPNWQLIATSREE